MDNRFHRYIKDSKKIAIFSHVTPDADALCSAFALKNLIYNNFDFKFVDVFIDGEIGELYDPILRDEVVNPKRPYNKYDLAIVLDCPNLERTGKYAEMAKQIPAIINIDHHETNSKFGTYNFVSSQVSSTCELVYWVAKGQKFDINNLIAKELYQGIITDTNCFTSRSINQRTHKAVSDLLTYRFDADAIKQYYFHNQSPAKTHLLTQALLSMEFYNNGTFTTMKIDNDTFTKTNATFEDTLGIIDNGMNISTTQASAILIERAPKYIHCSLRSRGNINVGEIAKEFNGGGSKGVAAFQTKGIPLEEVEKQLVELILPHLPKPEEPQDELLF